MATQNKKPKNVKEVLKKIGKIESLPKNVAETLPFRGITPQGIMETKPGHFTKQYYLEDINYQMAPPEEQATIFANFEEFQNTFNENEKWQFTIFSHKIDKAITMDNIRFRMFQDGLNPYRHVMNGVLVDQLCKGNNSITQDKYLTIEIEDDNLDHATDTFRRIDTQVSNGIRKITGSDTRPMSPLERMKLLYDIYNLDYDYRFPIIDDYVTTEGRYAADLNSKEKAHMRTLKTLEKQGVSIKDVIGPSGIDFTGKDYFMFGDMFGRVMYLDHVAASMTSEFMAELSGLQCNMLISTNSECYSTEDAAKLVKNRIADLKGEQAAKSKSYTQAGYGGDVSPDLLQAVEGANELLSDITRRNQKVIFMTFTIAIFAETKLLLEEFTSQAKTIAGRFLCALKPIRNQQEFGINTCMPYCLNELFVDRMYTSETSSVFLPYKSRELNQKNAIFYGLNKTTKNMILYDRMTGPNYNGLIFGFSGSGKSFTAKLEMVNVLLNHPDAQVFVIDPQGEYYPLCDALNGSRIELKTGGSLFLNPLDLDLTNDEESGNDPIATKSDFVMSMLDFMANGRPINPAARSVVDRCVRKIYRPYIEDIAQRTDGTTCDPEIAPTLQDLYKELERQESELADDVCTYLESYAMGSFKTFARRTNVQTNSRFVVYDIKSLSSGMRPLGLHICINDIWTRMMDNSRKEISTWFYIDEFHLLLSTETSAAFMKQIWKMARKWKGVPTGITQNTEEIFNSDSGRAIFNNTSFIIMLYESATDRQNLQNLLRLSDSQLDHISEARMGQGLIYNGKITLPFQYEFPKGNIVYDAITTAHDASHSPAEM